MQVSNELFFRHVHPDDRQKIKDAVAETLRTGRTYSIDHRIILPDGTERVIHELADLIRDEQGRPLRMMGTAQDVTERWRAEELLRQSEERFRQMIANGSDIIALVDQQGVIRFQSPSTERVLGHRPEYMAGRRIEEYIHAEDLAKVGAAMERVLAGQEKPLPVEYRCRHRDGSWRTLQSFGKAMTGSTGEKLIVVNSRDVTESRALEEQLRQSQKMEAIGQLSGGIAHDFNNLLTAIIGHLGLLRDNPQLTREIDESLSEISGAANRAAKLTSQLLAFSRRQVLSTSALDVNEVVTHLTKMLRRILGEHVIMQLDFAPEPLTFQGDAGLMEQVLVNLAVNARDAMPEGGTLKITTRSVTQLPPSTNDQPGPQQAVAYVRLSVGDTGTGILPEIRAKIFEPFFTTKEVGKGTGLGLATVFGIVQQHHGWIEVESEPGHGAVFHIFLPRLAVVPTVAPAPQPVFTPRGSNELVLLVEDEPAVQEMGTQALRRQGYRVVTASNGRTALEVWARYKSEIALLLTDMIMPEGVSGQQLARQLLEEKPALKVIYTSGYNAEIAGKELKLADGVNYLAKPYELEQLYRTVRSALDGTGTHSRPPFGEG